MQNKDFMKGFLMGILGAVLVCAAACLGYRLADPGLSGVLEDSAHVAKIETLESLIDQYYLGEKDEEQLAEGLYTGLVYGLGDRYSRYYTAEEYERASMTEEGQYEGIGINITKASQGGALIVECYDDSPATKAGLLAGDVILQVDGEDVSELSPGEISSLLRENGKKSVVLGIRREGEEELLQIQVDQGEIEIPSVEWELLSDGTGYLYISRFTRVSGEQFEKALADLQERGMERLIVDVRDNPGGYVDQVCRILRQILPEGLIVYTEDKNGKREEEFCDGEHELLIPMAVLVNENSASASEIFAGAVQDHGTGIIVGKRTFGKGIVQTIRSFKDGSAVKLTSSHYYTPSGQDIHGQGITPDFEVEQTEEGDFQLSEALRLLKMTDVA